jgi:hypothetical protein
VLTAQQAVGARFGQYALVQPRRRTATVVVVEPASAVAVLAVSRHRRSLTKVLGLFISGGLVVTGCTSGSAGTPAVPDGWTSDDAGPISIAVPRGFTVVDPAELKDLGPLAEGYRDAVFVARRGETASPPVDLIAVKESPLMGLSAETADSFSQQLGRLSHAPVETAEVRLRAGSGWRFATTVRVPLPDVDHPVVNAVVQWFIEVDGTHLNLTASRLGDGDQVPEADQIAETARAD